MTGSIGQFDVVVWRMYCELQVRYTGNGRGSGDAWRGSNCWVSMKLKPEQRLDHALGV